jgi:hypothetical protein
LLTARQTPEDRVDDHLEIVRLADDFQRASLLTRQSIQVLFVRCGEHDRAVFKRTKRAD